MKIAIIFLSILIAVPCFAGPLYKATVITDKILNGNYETSIASAYEGLTTEDKSPQTGITNPSVMVVEVIADNATLAQILSDGSYPVVMSEMIQSAGPREQPTQPDPALMIDSKAVMTDEELQTLAANLADLYGFVVADNGIAQAMPPCDNPLKCNEIQTPLKAASMAKVAKAYAGKTRQEVIYGAGGMVQMMKGLPK